MLNSHSPYPIGTRIICNHTYIEYVIVRSYTTGKDYHPHYKHQIFTDFDSYWPTTVNNIYYDVIPPLRFTDWYRAMLWIGRENDDAEQ